MTQPMWGDGSLESEAWNFCWLGEDLLPGIVEVTVQKSRAVDIKKQKNTDGANIEDQGYDPARVTIKLRITNAAQWAAYQEVLPKIDPQKPGGLKQPFAIVHPEPNNKGVHEVLVLDISGDPPTAKSGKVETIECVQWFPQPKPAKSKKDVKAKNTQNSPPPPLELPPVTGALAIEDVLV